MIDNKIIKEVKRRLVQTYNPLEIYIFGSYAWGVPNEESDLDLFIIIEKSKDIISRRAVKGHLALFGLKISKDIIVYTKEEFEKQIIDSATLSFKIKKEGKKIYAKA
ncbi:nucleotidyltransferase domain-containing protein [Candidatus Babeliales bacterium]|nr:nucleotidyltransferase domain-containing protein [Candidatus Babeliales bacterium]MCF7899205.1 nucleotidyltransferase domain-containing protein [Candidatus Babeliales bacterium]